MAVAVAVSSSAAAQQQTSGNPFEGLFKGSPREQPQSLDVRGSAFGAWDDNVLAQAPGGGPGGGLGNFDPRYVKPGFATGFQGSLAYAFRKSGTRSQVSVGGDAALQEFQSGGISSDPLWFHSYGLSTAFTTKLTNRTSMGFGANASYAPYYQYAPFLRDTASLESPVGNDYGYAVNSSWVRSMSVSASISNQLSRRSTITGGVGWDDRVIPDQNSISLQTKAASIAYSHSLTRKLGFHVGYGIQEQENAYLAGAGAVRSHLLDVGIGYGDGLTLTFGRHYTLNMGIGASIMKNGDPTSVLTTGKSSAFAIDGSATLSRSIGRSWGASVGYVRGTHYMVGFTNLVTTDSVNAGIGGPILDRLHFSAGGGASRGQQVFSTSTEWLVSYAASSQLNFALFSHLGVYAQASYYKFSVPASFLNFGFVPNLGRRSVSFGLTTWLPLIKPPRVRQDPGNQPTTEQP
jgi:hypothetical protein